MASTDHKKHIFLQEAPASPAFTAPASGRDRNLLLARDRMQHSERLRTQLESAWERAYKTTEERSAISLPVHDGIYVEFCSAPGYDLAIQSLENVPQGIRLLTVRTDESSNITYATVYIPKGREKFFLNRIKRYAEEQTKSGKPKNQTLIDSIEDIRLAVLESFWQDSIKLIPTDHAAWCEVWLRGDDESIEAGFRSVCGSLNITCQENSLRFPERTVVLVCATSQNLTNLIEASDNIAEFRRAKETAGFFLGLENADQTDWIRDLLDRLDVKDSQIAVCILDTGANNGHPLLEPLLADADCQSYRSDWHSSDHQGHGTLMCGLAGYGDLQNALEVKTPVSVVHRLESVKILPPNGENDPKLYGHITSRCISLAEVQAPARRRVICMAVTSQDGRDRGRPSSWSAAVDAIASGYADDQKRLIIVSAGNVASIQEWCCYPDSNLTNAVHDPGQAWNAVTVGAYTEKTIIRDSTFDGYRPVAAVGGLSPFSTTSLEWERIWATKPDVVLEGGNVAVNDDHSFASTCDDLSLVSTHSEHTKRQLGAMCMTSAATALAACMAAKIQAAYPSAWPETIRALLIHSAEWTDTMRQQFISNGSKTEYGRLLRICGYGVPDEQRAIECASNRLTLIAQQEMQPFICGPDGRPRTNEMHLYELPWPKEVLLDMGSTDVTMRVTLSYFIEPGPGEIGWRDRYRYPSHALRFDVNSPGENREEFEKRLNAAARDEGERTETSSGTDRWLIGSKGRNVGSVHSDVWRGPAAEIATSNLIGIYPVVGWWRERSYLGFCDKRTRYSLVVSISTQKQGIDLYTPIAVRLNIPITI